MLEGILKYNRINWILLAIVVLGFGLRIYQLDKHDFWYDEVVTFNQISDMHTGGNRDVSYRYFETHPPFYYLLLRQWSHIFGKNEFDLRFFSLIFNIFSIIAIYKISKIFFDEATSLLSAGFLAFSPFHIFYSQEARMFTLSAFLALLNVYLFLKASENGSNKYWLCYLLSSICLLSTTYFAFFLFLPQVIYMLYNRKFILKWTIIILSVILFFTIFAFPVFMDQLKTVQHKFWLKSPADETILLAT